MKAFTVRYVRFFFSNNLTQVFAEIRRDAATGQGECSGRCWAPPTTQRLNPFSDSLTFHPDKFPAVPTSFASLAAEARQSVKRPPAPQKPKEWIDKISIATTKTGEPRVHARNVLFTLTPHACSCDELGYSSGRGHAGVAARLPGRTSHC